MWLLWQAMPVYHLPVQEKQMPPNPTDQPGESCAFWGCAMGCRRARGGEDCSRLEEGPEAPFQDTFTCSRYSLARPEHLQGMSQLSGSSLAGDSSQHEGTGPVGKDRTVPMFPLSPTLLLLSGGHLSWRPVCLRTGVVPHCGTSLGAIPDPRAWAGNGSKGARADNLPMPTHSPSACRQAGQGRETRGDPCPGACTR